MNNGNRCAPTLTPTLSREREREQCKQSELKRNKEPTWNC